MHFELPPTALERIPVPIQTDPDSRQQNAVPEQLQVLFRQQGISLLLQKRDRLLREGEFLDGVYLVQAGQIRMWIKGHADQRGFCRIVGVGHLLGLATVFGQQPLNLNATATTNSCVAFVSRDCLMDFMKRRPDEALWVVRYLGDEVRHMTLKIGR